MIDIPRKTCRISMTDPDRKGATTEGEENESRDDDLDGVSMRTAQ